MFRSLFLMGVMTVALLSCATSPGRLGPVVDFFEPARADNPWNPKIENWQARHRLDPLVRGQEGASFDQSKLGRDYDQFTRKLRRDLVSQTVEWVQAYSRRVYRPDGDRDHWATLAEVVETGEDDCDGLDLLTFVLLRRLGFERDEIYRAIVVEDGTAQHHMVTLWFDQGSGDPYVLDPTGVVTGSMQRLSEVETWRPIELFDEARHFAVRGENEEALVAAD